MSRERELLDLIFPRIAWLAGRLGVGVATMESGEGLVFSIGAVEELFRFSNLENDFDSNRFDSLAREAGIAMTRVLRRSSKDAKDFEHGYHEEMGWTRDLTSVTANSVD